MEIAEIFATCIPVASIAVIAFAVGLFCKTWDRLDDKWIPCICAGLGGVLGVVGLYVIPDYPANNIMDAIMHGIFSGLVATGAHQIGKQFQKARKEKQEAEEDGK